MRMYEIIIIFHPSLTEEMRDGIVQKIKGIVEARGGSIVRIDQWGERPLSYPIKKTKNGIYIMLTYTGDGDIPLEIEKNLKFIEGVIRFINVKVKEEVNEEEIPSAREKAFLLPQFMSPLAQNSNKLKFDTDKYWKIR